MSEAEEPTEVSTEEIQEVDRDTDLYFVLLAADETEPEGLYRSMLAERLQSLDPNPFPFEIWRGYAEFMDTLRFLEALKAIPYLNERHRITLTNRGREIADQLVDRLDKEQRRAVQEVTAEDGDSA